MQPPAPSSSPRPQHPAAFHWPPPLHRHLSESLCHLPISDLSTPGPGGLGFRTPYCVGSRAAYPVWARRSPGNRLCSCKVCRPGSFGAWPSPFFSKVCSRSRGGVRHRDCPVPGQKERAIQVPADQSPPGWPLRPWAQWFVAGSQYILAQV